MNDPVETIETSAFDAWPAEEVEGLGGWRLRAMRGVTRRANSVWTLEAVGEATVEERIDAVEDWYVLRRLAPMFQISDRSRPAGLDAALERRGYGIEAPVSIQVAATKDVVSTGCERDVVVTHGLPDVWFEISARGGRFAEVADIYRGLLLRIGSGARFALARVDGQAAAVGLGVVGRGWMGIFSMLTLAAARRRGAASAVLGGLARTAREEGVESLYLQVERGNSAATALYASASFRELHGYHYRISGTPGRPAR